jgi:hypothetical protein
MQAQAACISRLLIVIVLSAELSSLSLQYLRVTADFTGRAEYQVSQNCCV